MTKSVAYLVDGDLEKRFIGQCCKGSPIRKIGNGDAFPIQVIAKQAVTHIRLLGNRYQEVVVLLDLEKRDSTPREFAENVMQAINEAGVGDQSVRVFVKEREVEDWILADPTAVSEFVGCPVDLTSARGKWGLVQALRAHEIRYNEMTVGADLLKAVVCSRAAEVSPTLAYVQKNFPIECWWITR